MTYFFYRVALSSTQRDAADLAISVTLGHSHPAAPLAAQPFLLGLRGTDDQFTVERLVGIQQSLRSEEFWLSEHEVTALRLAFYTVIALEDLTDGKAGLLETVRVLNAIDLQQCPRQVSGLGPNTETGAHEMWVTLPADK